MKPTDASLLISMVFAGIEDMADTITTIAHDIKPHLPHPTNLNLITPLYITLTAFTAFIITLRIFSKRIQIISTVDDDSMGSIGNLPLKHQVFIASGFRLQAIRGSYTDDSKSDNAFLFNAWTIVELNLALIFASTPSVRALAIHYISRISGSVHSPSSALDPNATTKPPTEKDRTGNGIVAANSPKPNAESQSARV
ncbi:hypothetical protein TWF106_011333 [Orbilia oligospora]|uniref:Uncharacterized protein n=1 Tax=Orbilia oligospora TaxID=2813651 RepID=A0A7C8UI35_ORBOL|nr:hypothetical protein TWF106_011333 [Orbilia oligospora]